MDEEILDECCDERAGCLDPDEVDKYEREVKEIGKDYICEEPPLANHAADEDAFEAEIGLFDPLELVQNSLQQVDNVEQIEHIYQFGIVPDMGEVACEADIDDDATEHEATAEIERSGNDGRMIFFRMIREVFDERILDHAAAG